MLSIKFWREYDFVLLLVTVILIIYGVMMINSATIDAIDPDIMNRTPSQIRYALIGLAIMFIVSAIDYRLLGAVHTWIYGFILFLLGLVAGLGVIGAAGAQRWLNVGIPVQPSELGKVLLIITLGQFLATRYQDLDKLTTLLGSLAYMGAPVGLIFLQPNLGTSILLMFIWGVMVWGAGLRFRHIALFLVVAVVFLPLLWFNMEEYQQARITDFLAPPAEGEFDNVAQATIAIGSGGLLGQGYAHGTQTRLRFLRVRWTDFIFAVTAHELGFVGGTLIVVLMLILLMRILRIARSASDPLGSLICYGVAGLIYFQTFVSIGMNLKLIPVTGLTLPFISSGGSSLLTLLFGLGLVESVNIHRHDNNMP